MNSIRLGAIFINGPRSVIYQAHKCIQH